MKHLILIFIVLGGVHSSFAGVRSVGKGGGYAEMQALWINLRMASLTQPCEVNPSQCGLTKGEMDEVQKASQPGFEIRIMQTCAEGPIQILGPDLTRLQMCALYWPATPGNSPRGKSFNDIATLVLSARLMARLSLAFADAIQLAAKLFANFAHNDAQSLIALDHGEFIFHVLTFQFAEQRRQVISLEGTATTMDLTPLIEQIPTCGNSSHVRQEIEPMRATKLGSDQGLMESQIIWSCPSNESWRGILQIYFASQSGEVIPSSVRVRIVSRQKSSPR